jgi:hypothetical protein
MYFLQSEISFPFDSDKEPYLPVMSQGVLKGFGNFCSLDSGRSASWGPRSVSSLGVAREHAKKEYAWPPIFVATQRLYDLEPAPAGYGQPAMELLRQLI